MSGCAKQQCDYSQLRHQVLPILVSIEDTTRKSELIAAANVWNTTGINLIKIVDTGAKHTVKFIPNWTLAANVQAITKLKVVDNYYGSTIEVNVNQLPYLDFTALMVHELGHSLGLVHIVDESSVMHPTLYPNQNRNKLGPIEQEVIQCLYNRGTAW